MDYKTLMQAVEGMNDEELLLAEKKINEERRRRAGQAAAHAIVTGNDLRVLIDLAPLLNGVRESLRIETSMCSDAALASVLDQIKDISPEYGSESAVLRFLSAGLTAALVHEAQCEAARRLDSVR